MTHRLTEIEHYLKLAEQAVRSAEGANELDSFRHFRDEALRAVRAARMAAAANAPLPLSGADRLPSLSLVA